MASLAASQSALHAAAPCRQTLQQRNACTAAFAAPLRHAVHPQQRGRKLASGSRRTLVVAAAAQAEGVGKLISKVEIPAFIPRADILDQLLRWAYIEVQENGVANTGSPCKVTPFKRNDEIWGFTVSFLKDGTPAADIRVAFDEEVTQKHDWIGRGADGMPVMEGNAENVVGKHFEIRKVCDREVTDSLRASIREFCQILVSAVNKYYAFGSCFSEDAT